MIKIAERNVQRMDFGRHPEGGNRDKQRYGEPEAGCKGKANAA
jgi:hypothetical protein